MKRFRRLLSLSLALSLVPLLLAGCGGRRFPVRPQASKTEVVTIDLDMQQAQTTAPQQENTAQANGAAESAETPTATQPAQIAPSPDTADDSLDELMDDLETALNDLDGALSAADQDALQDSALAALGK